MYDYPTWSGLGVMAGERRVPQNPNLNVQLPIAPLTTPVTTSSASTSTATPPAPSQVVTGTPGASLETASTATSTYTEPTSEVLSNLNWPAIAGGGLALYGLAKGQSGMVLLGLGVTVASLYLWLAGDIGKV
jgi:hypothetical protein